MGKKSFEGFGERFWRAVQDSGLPRTQDALGKVLGLSGPTVWAYKNGAQMPGMANAAAIATKLGCCVEWLMTGRGPRDPNAREAPEGWEQLSPEHRKLVQMMIKTLITAAPATATVSNGTDGRTDGRTEQ